MRSKTRYLIVALPLALGLTLSSCSSSSDNANDSQQNSSSCPDGVVNLTLLTSENSVATDEQMVSEWQADNPCIKVERQAVPFSQLFDRISVTASSTKRPDVVLFDGPQTQTLAAAGVLLPLDDYISDDVRKDILPSTIVENTYDGKLYSPGLSQDTLALYYNKDLLAAAGVAEPPQTLEDAWTWPTAIDAFGQCQQGPVDNPDVWGLGPSHIGDGSPGFGYRDLLFQRSAGDPNAPEDSSEYKTFWALSKDGTQVDGWLNTPEAIEALGVYQSLYQGADAVTPTAGIPNAFIDQKACFMIQGPKFTTDLENTDNLGFDWGVTPLPYFTTPVVHTGSVTLGVTSTTEHPAEAAQFVLDISTGSYNVEFLKRSGQLPNLLSERDQLPDLQSYPWTMFMDQVEQWGQPRPPTTHYMQYDDEVTKALHDIALGADPTERINSAVTKLTPILSK